MSAMWSEHTTSLSECILQRVQAVASGSLMIHASRAPTAGRLLNTFLQVSVAAHCCTHVAGERPAGHSAVLTKALACQAWRAAAKWAMPAHAGCWGYHWTHAAQGLPRAEGRLAVKQVQHKLQPVSCRHTADTQSVGNAQQAWCGAVAC